MQLPVPSTLGECGVGGASVKSSETQGEQLAKRQAGGPNKKMTGHLYASIMLYTSNAIYQDLNKCLRDQNRSKIKKYFKYLRLLFEAMDHLPKEKRTLWRGISVDLMDSSDYDVGKCTLFTIESKTSTDIAQMSFFGNEKESLMAPGTQLQVTSKKRNGNVAEIHLKETARLIG